MSLFLLVLFALSPIPGPGGARLAQEGDWFVSNGVAARIDHENGSGAALMVWAEPPSPLTTPCCKKFNQ